LCFALYSSSIAMTRAYQPLLAPLNLTCPPYLVMLVMWEADGLSVGDLGRRLNLDSGTLTPLLKRLEQAGWVARTRDADDERRVRVTLTKSGRALRARASGIPKALLSAAGCSVGEVGALTAQLQQLRDRLLASLPDAA
jgi:DNA-binding MarR family transcriptional regulator